MFGRRIRLFTLFGFEIAIDLSWFVIAILITWSLAEGLFPSFFQDENELAPLTRWVMGAMGAVGLFAQSWIAMSPLLALVLDG